MARRDCSARCRGLAILGNTRLALPAARLLRVSSWRLAAGWTLGGRVGVVLAATRARRSRPGSSGTRSSVGCFTITTDAPRALEGEQPEHLRHCSRTGKWIDDVPGSAGRAAEPRGGRRHLHGRRQDDPRSTSARQMRFYQHRLVASSGATIRARRRSSPRRPSRMLWDPRTTRPRATGVGRRASTPHALAQPLYTVALFVLALARRLRAPPRRFVVLALALLAYQTVVAMVFAGATRYRVAVGLPARAARRGRDRVGAPTSERRR